MEDYWKGLLLGLTDKRIFTAKMRKSAIGQGRQLAVALQAAKCIRSDPRLGDHLL
jgi:hypothetical protein